VGTVASELNAELQFSEIVRGKLADKLIKSECDLGLSRKSEKELLARAEAATHAADTSAREVELLRARAAAAEASAEAEERQHSRVREEMERQLADLSLELQQVTADRDVALNDRDVLLQTVSTHAEALCTHRVEVARAMAQAGDLELQLRERQAQLEDAIARAERSEREKSELEVRLNSFQEHHGTGVEKRLEAIVESKLMVDKLSRQIASTEEALGEQQGSAVELQAENLSLKRLLLSAEVKRIELHNQIQEIKGNIRVVCRVRPAEADDLAVHLQDSNLVHLNCGFDAYTASEYAFSFDKVLGPDATQGDVFDEVSGLVQSALDGYKICIFAYGQTGSGKTHTMQGAESLVAAGIIPRSVAAIFDASESLRTKGWSWSVQASYLEVYNEQFRDLLRGGGDAAAGPVTGLAPTSLGTHVVVQDEAFGTMVTGATCINVESAAQLAVLLAKAQKQRSFGATDMNTMSSRSHVILALYLRGTNNILNLERSGAVHLVDLAGSERLDRSGATGERLRETQNINRSLATLAHVFTAKAERRSHVPFRNSKLTHLMEPCLSGQGKTLMIVNVQADQSSAHETLCSLRFAQQVSQCSTGGKPRRSVRQLGSGAAPERRPSLTSETPRSSPPPVPRSREASRAPKAASVERAAASWASRRRSGSCSEKVHRPPHSCW
jgi:hypothetical protein